MDLHALPLDHVAVAVSNLEEALPAFELLSGASGSPPATVTDQGVRILFVGAGADGPRIELIEPLTPESPVGRFLRDRGPGLHHIAYRTPDIDAELDRLRAAGVRLVDERPRMGGAGHRIAFVHPESAGGVLVELVEAD